MGHFKECSSILFAKSAKSQSIPIWSALQVSPLSSGARSFVPIFWRAPPRGWIKVNTDGSCKSNEVAGCGGIFRDSNAQFLGAFARSSYLISSTAAEILAVIEAIELAWVQDWHHLWLETDSTYIVHLLYTHSMEVPWPFKVAWANCLWRVRRMNIHFTHIFREGNRVADIFANYGADHEGKFWWSSLPDFALASFQRDTSRLPHFRSI